MIRTLSYFTIGTLTTILLITDQVAAANDAVLPADVKVVWDTGKAHREKTATRERICLNGLWRWQPALLAPNGTDQAVPADGWGFFKVPGFWPGAASYIQEDSQTLHVHPSWKNADLRNLAAAWYQREFTVPADWTGRRVALTVEYVNSLAIVFVDGMRAGEIRFPAGEVDLTGTCKPGRKHTLSLQVIAMPLKGVLLSYSDTNAAREVKGHVERRGLCGDVWLTSTPQGPRITDVKVDTSVRKGEIAFSAALANPGRRERHAAAGPFRPSGGQNGAALAERPLPRCARGMGFSLPLLPLVIRHSPTSGGHADGA
jgi:beta-galactosidase